MKLRILWCAAVMAVMVPAYAQRPVPEVTAVAAVDLDRYAGKWHEIARLPNWFEAKCIGEVSAEYRKRADGRLDVINRCRRSDRSFDQSVGMAEVVDAASHAKLKVRFAPAWLSWLPMVWGDYWIIALAPDYSYAVVGEPERRYLWILSRTPKMDDGAYRAAIRQAEEQGFDVTRLIKTGQQESK
ncbi:MAG: lipocalin family protein [Burkholderiaceae bacterium]|nr:lipocalin family protein [Burkholderiaceae bacterium]